MNESDVDAGLAPSGQGRDFVNAPTSPARERTARRWDILDVARGIAIAAMIVYHFSWDLSFLRLIATNIVAEPGWQWFARSIAGSFLTLAGIGLVLAHGAEFRPAPFLRRLAKVGGAALAITAVTYVLVPDSYIFFGILHAIAVCSVLALPFLRAPFGVTAVAALASFAAPWLFTSPELDHPLLDWLGLGLLPPRTNDYVPVFPWFGLVLVGVLLGKTLSKRPPTASLSRWRAADPMTRTLAFAGRKSLPIYLLHQPILLGLLFGALQVTGPNPSAEAQPFLRQCRSSCVQSNGNVRLCRAVCDCALHRLRQEGLWSSVLADRVTPEQQTRISEVAQQCFAQPRAEDP
jgi:uncharacterized membrane protein